MAHGYDYGFMTSPETNRKHVIVIGGGISGLAAAHRVMELEPRYEVSLLEAGARVGGVLQTDSQAGFLIERSADMFTTIDPWAQDLCQRIGLGKSLISTNEQGRGASVVVDGMIHRVPPGFSLMAPAKLWPMITTPILSVRAKLRLAREPFIRPRLDDADESIESFAVRRLGRETYDKLIQPLVAGIYVARGDTLSINATLPRFRKMEMEHGSLLRGMRHATDDQPKQDDQGARYSVFVAPKLGMQSLVDTLANRLPETSVQLNSAVQRVSMSNDQWQVVLESGRSITADGVIICTPSWAAAGMLDESANELRKSLSEIEYASSAIAVMAFRRNQFPRPVNAFGFVVPQIEQRPLLACSFSSIKFAERAPEDGILVRLFFGGAVQPETLQRSDDELLQLAQDELRSLLQLQGEPLFAHLQRWPRSMPQYHVGHLDRVARIEQQAEQFDTLRLAGNAYRGVGIPFCIRSGETAAEAIVQKLRQRSRSQ